MSIFIIMVLVSVIAALAAIVHFQSQTIDAQAVRMMTALNSSDSKWAGLMDAQSRGYHARELRLESDVRALTEALGRSKEYVQVVYPRDPAQPLEESPGWFDGKPKVRPINANIRVVTE